MKISSILKKIIRRIIKLLKQFELVFYKTKVQCNICGSWAKKFESDDWHLYCGCKYCSSGVRQRLIWEVLKNNNVLPGSSCIENKKVLHFAPDKSLINCISKKCSDYFTADLLAKGYNYSQIDYNIDISNMDSLQSESFDCIIACDVLEHVENDEKAIKESHRILSKGGYCIFTVPQKDNLEKTFEDKTITDTKTREALYGQGDHLRIYGADFKEILERNGFEIQIIDHNSFDKKAVKKHVLFPPVISEKPLATNYRKIYFGRKV